MKHGLTPQTTSNYDDIDGVPSNYYLYIYIHVYNEYPILILFYIVDEDIDGVPMDDEDNVNVRNKEDEKKPAMPAGFVPSRWETVDPDQVFKNSFFPYAYTYIYIYINGFFYYYID